MKLFQDLNRYITQNATVSLVGNNPVNVAECSNTIFQGLLALHVLRQEPESHHVIREYAENTLQIANSTGLYEFLHVMHTEVLREHARDEKSYFTKSEVDQQIRVTHEFLHACSEMTYPHALQNQRLLQLESSYKITSTVDKKLRRDVANWKQLDADTRWAVCQKLWENIHRTQGLRDIRNCLRRYVQEQKWPAPVTGEKPPVSAANRMQLLTRLPVVKENLEASQGVKDLEDALTKTQDHSYEHIDGIMKKISAKLGITPQALHLEFKKQHSMTPDDWVRQTIVRGLRENSSMTEAIKGWKHAGRDINKWRAEKAISARPAKLVRLKKDGTESGMHDATSTFDSEEAARQQHERMVSYNPGKQIRHNLYIDNTIVATLDGSLKESASSGGTSAGAIASVANPMGKVNRRPSLFGYVPEQQGKKTRNQRKNIFQVGDQVKSKWVDNAEVNTITRIDGDFIHTEPHSFFNKPNSFFHHENYVLHKRRQDV